VGNAPDISRDRVPEPPIDMPDSDTPGEHGLDIQ